MFKGQILKHRRTDRDEVCFLIHSQSAPSYAVSTIEEPAGTVRVSKTIF